MVDPKKLEVQLEWAHKALEESRQLLDHLKKNGEGYGGGG
jgi:hypothetical protein